MRPADHGETSAFRGLISIVEFDVLVEDDLALLVAHDVVAVQAVAVLVEIVFALGALVALRGEDRVADFVRIGRAGLVDRGAEHADRVIGPGAVIVGLASWRPRDIALANSFASGLEFLGVVGDAVGALKRGAGEFKRIGDDDRRRSDPGNRDAELAQLPRENREIVIEGEIRADDVGARLLDRQHDRR